VFLNTLSLMRLNFVASCFSVAILVIGAPVLASAQTPASPAATGSGLLSQPGANFAVKDSELPQNFSIIVYGDMRFTDPTDTKDADPDARRALVAQIAEGASGCFDPDRGRSVSGNICGGLRRVQAGNSGVANGEPARLSGAGQS
jgi:hypothetical protein